MSRWTSAIFSPLSGNCLTARAPSLSKMTPSPSSPRGSAFTTLSLALKPRIYALLYLIGYVAHISEFEKETDDSLPYTDWTLPAKFNNASGRVSFLKNQQLVWSESHRNAQTQARSHTILPRGEADKCLRYITLLGHGSYGIVDSVEGNFSGIEYARKLVHTTSSYRRKERVTALTEEIQSLKRLRHHHLIQYVGSYADDTVLAFLMLPVA